MEGLDRLPRARALTEYPIRHNQNWTHVYNAPPTNMQHYQSSSGVNYMSGSHHATYSPVATTYPGYTSPYMASSNSQAAFYLPTSTAASMPYSVRPPPRSATLPSQHRMLSRAGYCPSNAQSQHATHLPLRTSLAMDVAIMDTEEQESVNGATMRSEPIDPPLQGYPNVGAFDNLMKKYACPTPLICVLLTYLPLAMLHSCRRRSKTRRLSTHAEQRTLERYSSTRRQRLWNQHNSGTCLEVPSW